MTLKKQKKQIVNPVLLSLGLTFLVFFVFGCANKSVQETMVPMTMHTDLLKKDLSRAEYYEQMAIGYSLNGQPEKSIEYFRLSILHNSKRISPYLALSDQYKKINRNHLALVELNQALKLEPNNFDVLKKTADLYLLTKIYPKARELYQRMLVNDIRREEVQWALLHVYKIEKKYNDALDILFKIKVNENNKFKVNYEKAMVYKLTGENDLYNSNLALAYEENPRERQILLEYVENAFAQKNFKEATTALIKFSNTYEFDIEISNKLSYSSVQSENYDIALREYSKQMSLLDVTFSKNQKSNSMMNALNLNKAHAYYLLGDLKNAEKIYLSLSEEKENDEANFYLAQIYFSKNNSNRAVRVLGKIPAASHYYAEAQVLMALYEKSLQNKGLTGSPVNRVRLALQQRPDQQILYKAYVDFLIEEKRYTEASPLLERAIQLFELDEDLRLKMAYVQYHLNKQDAAKKQIFMALKTSGKASAEAYAMLAEIGYLEIQKQTGLHLNNSGRVPAEQKTEQIPLEINVFVKRAIELKSTNKNIKPLLAWILMQQDSSAEVVTLLEELHEENPNDVFIIKSLAQVYSRNDIKEKSKELAKIAVTLENKETLRSNFLLHSKKQYEQIGDRKLDSARLPANLPDGK